jgi:hypothetical protein
MWQILPLTRAYRHGRIRSQTHCISRSILVQYKSCLSICSLKALHMTICSMFPLPYLILLIASWCTPHDDSWLEGKGPHPVPQLRCAVHHRQHVWARPVHMFHQCNLTVLDEPIGPTPEDMRWYAWLHQRQSSMSGGHWPMTNWVEWTKSAMDVRSKGILASSYRGGSQPARGRSRWWMGVVY